MSFHSTNFNTVLYKSWSYEVVLTFTSKHFLKLTEKSNNENIKTNENLILWKPLNYYWFNFP